MNNMLSPDTQVKVVNSYSTGCTVPILTHAQHTSGLLTGVISDFGILELL
jgi:hypothetical protein